LSALHGSSEKIFGAASYTEQKRSLRTLSTCAS
jgi:hypothetical protein